MTFLPDVPGRGAWTRRGGLLPLKTGTASVVGYYRVAQGAEAPVGAAFVRTADRSDSARAVNAGVRALQLLLNARSDAKLADDGWLGQATGAAIRDFQVRSRLTADGIAGPSTLRALLEPVITAIAGQIEVPADVLGGICVLESALDPAAVGENGWDHGICQINLDPESHGSEVDWDDAMDPWFALEWSARDLKRTHDAWVGKTKADPWDIAVANHNSPRSAREWAAAGKPTYNKNRRVQIDAYVRLARTSW